MPTAGRGPAGRVRVTEKRMRKSEPGAHDPPRQPGRRGTSSLPGRWVVVGAGLAGGAAAVAGWALAARVGALAGAGAPLPLATAVLAATLTALFLVRIARPRHPAAVGGPGGLDTHLLLKALEQSPSGVVITDPEGKVVYVNPRFEEISGYSFELIRGCNPRVLKSGKMSADVYGALWQTIRAGGTWRGELLNRRRSGEEYWVAASISGVRNGRGSLTHFVGVQEEITRRKEAEDELVRIGAELERQRRLLEEVLRATPDSILMVNRQGEVVFANRSAHELAAAGGGRINGLWNELPFTAPASDHFELDRQNALGTGRSVGGHVQVAMGGSARELEYALTPVAGAGGETETVVATVRDVTERQAMERAVRASEARFRALVQNSYDMITVLAADGTIQYESPSVERLLGWRSEERIGKSVFEWVHPEDLPTVLELYRKALADPEFRVLTLESRIRHHNGEWRSVQSVATNSIDDPAIGGFVVNSRDITESKRVEEAVRDSEQKYRLLFSRVFDAVSLFDADSGQFLDANDAYQELVGYTREELLGMSTFELSAEPEQSLATRDELVTNGTARVPVRWLKRRDGTIFPVELSAGIFTYRGRPVVCSILRDITERLQTQATLERLSTTDSLTGIANRRVFDQVLVEEWKRAGRDGSPISLVMLDIDAFKAFNDTYGHPAGDACLRQVADLVRHAARRAGDLVARYGGEEFVALMPGTTLEGAREVAELIRRQVEALSIVHATSPTAPVVTVSLGVASLAPSPPCTPLQLLEAADRALYRAKSAGRNRVVWEEPAAAGEPGSGRT